MIIVVPQYNVAVSLCCVMLLIQLVQYVVPVALFWELRQSFSVGTILKPICTFLALYGLVEIR